MKKTDRVYVKVGKFGSTYGVHGWLKVQSFTEFCTNILEYQPWYLEDNHHEQQVIPIEEARMHGNSVIAKLTGIDSPEAARLLTGKIISIDRTQLTPLPNNHFYWSDLEGLAVRNQQGGLLGKVIYLIATGSNDVLVVKGDNTKETAIPYLPNVILKVDLEKQEITVDWEPI